MVCVFRGGKGALSKSQALGHLSIYVYLCAYLYAYLSNLLEEVLVRARHLGTYLSTYIYMHIYVHIYMNIYPNLLEEALNGSQVLWQRCLEALLQHRLARLRGVERDSQLLGHGAVHPLALENEPRFRVPSNRSCVNHIIIDIGTSASSIPSK